MYAIPGSTGEDLARSSALDEGDDPRGLLLADHGADVRRLGKRVAHLERFGFPHKLGKETIVKRLVDEDAKERKKEKKKSIGID